MVEIRLSPFPKEILRIWRSYAGKTISFHSSVSSWSPVRLREVVSVDPVTDLWFVVVRDSISFAERCAVFKRLSTLSLADDWRVMEVLMYLNHPMQASRWVEYFLNWMNAYCWWRVFMMFREPYFIWLIWRVDSMMCLTQICGFGWVFYLLWLQKHLDMLDCMEKIWGDDKQYLF